MAKNLYVTSTEPRSGKSAVALGLMEMLLRKLGKVAFFRPIVNIDDERNQLDKDIQLISTYFKLPLDHNQMYAYTFQQANDMIAAGRQLDLLEGILDKYKKLEEEFNFVLCEGTDFESPSSPFELDINIEIANNLGSPVLPIVNAHKKSMPEILDATKVTLESFESRGCNVLACIVNRALVEDPRDFQETIRMKVCPNRLLYVIPEDIHLDKPSLGEVAKWLNAEVLYGGDRMNRHVYHYTVAAMQVKSFLGQIRDRSLVIVPGDREDIILSSLLSLMSSYFPNISGILLTDGLKPDETVWRLITGLTDFPVPILRVKEDTFTAATKVSQTYARITPDNQRKLATVMRVFESNVDVEKLAEKIVTTRPTRLSPKMFEYSLVHKAKSKKMHIVLPEGKEERILRAAEVLLQRDVAKITLLGDVPTIREKIRILNLRMDQAQIIDPAKAGNFDEYAETYFQLRKHKGITPDNARDVMTEPTYYGTMMVYKGDANGMVSGSINTTAHTIRPALEFVRTKEGFSIVSSVFFMCLEDRVLVYGDCAVNPNPTAEQLSEIAISSADTARQFGMDPKVAMLSYSTGSSGKGADVEKVTEATRLAKQKRPDLKIEGPLQYDAAVDLSVAKTKMPNSEVAGQANVFIFPDLNTGNNTYKAVQRSAKAVAVGPVLQGLRKPVNDLSRGCTIPDIVNTVAITAIQAQWEDGKS